MGLSALAGRGTTKATTSSDEPKQHLHLANERFIDRSAQYTRAFGSMYCTSFDIV
jgi:hypothetical protein